MSKIRTRVQLTTILNTSTILRFLFFRMPGIKLAFLFFAYRFFGFSIFFSRLRTKRRQLVSTRWRPTSITLKQILISFFYGLYPSCSKLDSYQNPDVSAQCRPFCIHVLAQSTYSCKRRHLVYLRLRTTSWRSIDYVWSEKALWQTCPKTIPIHCALLPLLVVRVFNNDCNNVRSNQK